MRIYIYDAWGAHWDETAAELERRGHEVRKGPYWGPDLTDWCDVQIFHAVQNNLIQASKNTARDDTITIAEAVDIDIYAGHMGGVNWHYVDHLVYMATHMREYAEERFAHKLPKALPRHTIQGGVNLDNWTLINREIGYNVAWIGHLWIAKNLIGALQVFNQLIKTYPEEPWRFHALGRKWSPTGWWPRAVEGYLDANPDLTARFTLTEDRVPSIDEWLDDKDYLLHTGLKEAFGYVIAQAAAKGIRPVVMQTMGTDLIWPVDWIFQTHDEAVKKIHAKYHRPWYRDTIADIYPIETRADLYEELFK